MLPIPEHCKFQGTTRRGRGRWFLSGKIGCISLRPRQGTASYNLRDHTTHSLGVALADAHKRALQETGQGLHDIWLSPGASTFAHQRALQDEYRPDLPQGNTS